MTAMNLRRRASAAAMGLGVITLTPTSSEGSFVLSWSGPNEVFVNQATSFTLLMDLQATPEFPNPLLSYFGMTDAVSGPGAVISITRELGPSWVSGPPIFGGISGFNAAGVSGDGVVLYTLSFVVPSVEGVYDIGTFQQAGNQAQTFQLLNCNFTTALPSAQFTVVVPEPTTLGLVTGSALLALRRRRAQE